MWIFGRYYLKNKDSGEEFVVDREPSGEPIFLSILMVVAAALWCVFWGIILLFTVPTFPIHEPFIWIPTILTLGLVFGVPVAVFLGIRNAHKAGTAAADARTVHFRPLERLIFAFFLGMFGYLAICLVIGAVLKMLGLE